MAAMLPNPSGPDLSASSHPSGMALAPQQVRGLLWTTAALLLVGLVGLGAWTSQALLSSGVVSSGRIIVETRRKTVQHLEGGIVASILVQESQRVAAGEVLITLEDTQAITTLTLLQTKYAESLAMEARLLAERMSRSALEFPARLQEVAPAGSLETIVEGQRALFRTRRQGLQEKRDILRQKIVQLEKQIHGYQAVRVAKRSKIGLLQKEIAGLDELFSKGYASHTRLLELQREEKDLEGELGQLDGEIARTEVAIGETRIQISQLDSEFLNEVESQLRDTRSELMDLVERLKVAEDVARRTHIRAPQAGRIVGLTVFTPGGAIAPRQPLMDIVPEDDRLVVSARIEPKDIDAIHVGLPVEIQLNSLPRARRPELQGRIARISSDSLESTTDGSSYFEALVEVDGADLARAPAGLLQPGLPADVLIKTGERTALELLLQPLLDNWHRAVTQK
ncbi:MAG: HlyD family type I secretion periplasmic adaptor subunit [Magnetococcus sp. WYHC-3]